MHIRALQQRVMENANREDIIREMMNICALGPDPKEIEALSDCKCLPVKLPSGETKWLNKHANFAIVDRREYGDVFRGKISMLDLSLEEVHSLKVILLGLGLHRFYTSIAVQETTSVQGGLINESLTESLRKKAYAICR